MKPIDKDAILACADDQDSRGMLARIFAWRDDVAARNEFSKNDNYFTISLHGLKLNFRVSNAFSAIETFHEIFIGNNHCMIPEFMPEQAGTVVDIGANQGFYSLRVAQANSSSRICCFEPNPFEFESLARNLASNHVSGRVVAHNLAVAAQPGGLEMEVIPQIGPIGGRSVRTPERKWLKEEFIKRILVKAVSLDEAIRCSRFQKIDTLKIDVEGLELEILSNFHSFDAIERMVVEYHSPMGRDGLTAMMRDRGFALVFEDVEPGDYYGDLYFARKGRV